MTQVRETPALGVVGLRRVWVLVALGALSAFGPLSLDLYLPSLPELGRDLGTTDALAQLTMSMCMVGLAVGQLLAGPLSDRIGRRRPLVIGVALYAIMSVLCALAPTIWALIGFRLLQGLAGAAGLVIARAIVRDLFQGAEAARIFSLMMLVSGLAPILAPLAGGQLARFTDWRGMFVALAVVGVVLTLAALTLPETLPEDRRQVGGLRATRRQFAVLGRDRHFTGYALVLALSSCSLFTYIALSSFVLQDAYEISAQSFSIIFASNSLGIVLGGNLNGLLVRRAGPRRLLVAGVAAGLTGGVIALIAVLAGWGLPGLLSGLFLSVASLGLVLPNTTALAMEPHGERAGTASALLGLFQFFVGAVVPPLASLGGATALSMIVTMACSSIAALVVFVLMTSLRPGRTSSPTASAAVETVVPPI